MSKYLRIACNLMLELTFPVLLIISLLMVVILLLKPFLGNLLQSFFILVPSGEQWNIVARGWDALWYTTLPALTICGAGLFFGISIGIAQYEIITGSNTRRRLDQAQQRYLNAESAGLTRAKQQLRKGFEEVSASKTECYRQVLAAERRAEAAERRAESAESLLASASEDLARLEARKSSAQGAAERHKRRNRQKPRADDEDDYSGNPNPR